ncbi:hypothetical protein EYF80_025081 [Liparis tanakae]|uniref:Uncharacterized protein n=1 Tax=Liparis tanakae TaxID=230148 RepID=A0A4Z2HIC8_9TELE|nr:hypothetical protein EYF80_025081 [Liparis tanakae]
MYLQEEGVDATHLNNLISVRSLLVLLSRQVCGVRLRRPAGRSLRLAARRQVQTLADDLGALWEAEFVVGLWFRLDQSLPVILSKVSRWRQRATCSLLSSI